jgi:outer membrane receptor protein involved in Fe transport
VADRSGFAVGKLRRLRRASLALTILAAVGCTALAAAPVLAQDIPDEYEYEDILEEVIVTGTRIARSDYVSASPIVTVSDSLFDLSGSPSVQRMLETLPQFTPWITETTNNPPGPAAVGAAILDLRGLGPGRTLVLLDGRRLVSPDVNFIPQAILGSVEIITGGASAVYGSDAIAGVVNFRTRRFAGLETEASWEETDRGDGTIWHAGITGGLEFSRGYAFAYFGYDERDPVYQGDRSFSELGLGYYPDLGGWVPDGSGTIRQGKWNPIGFNLPSQEAIDAYLGRVDPSYTPGAVHNWRPFGFNPDGSLFSQVPVYNFTGDRNEHLQPVHPDYYSYNFAPPNYLRTPLERANAFAKAGIELSDDTELFLQALWAKSRGSRQLAPTPMSWVYIRPDNPFIHPDFAALLASRPDPDGLFAFAKRMDDLGPRQYEADYEMLQIVAGALGKVGVLPGWQYEAYLSLGGEDSTLVRRNLVSRTAFEELSLAPDAGASICGGEGMNPFGIGSISPECGAHFARSARKSVETRQLIGEATATGPVFALPAGEIRAAVGVQYRKDKIEHNADPTLGATRIDPVYGFEVPDIGDGSDDQSLQGRTDSWELYAEASVPLLSERSFAQLLELTAGYRYANHSNAGSIDAWKAEAIWRIREQLMMRSSYQRAVRAPEIQSLFEAQVSRFWDLGPRGEPCEFDYEDQNGQIPGAQQDPDVAALCIAQGIPADVLPRFFDSDGVFDVLYGGNPELGPETADTFTLGLVLSSPWDGAFADLQASVDYYNIQIDDLIGYVEDLLFPCYDRRFNPNLDPENFYCRRFDRDPGTFEVTNALNTAVNVSEMATSGYDIQLEYAIDAGPGRIRLHGVATHVTSATFTPAPGVPTTEYAGKATGYIVTSSSAVFSLVPRWKGVIDLGYTMGGLFTNLRWRYVGDLVDADFEDYKLPSRQYLDLTLGYEFDSGGLSGLSFYSGVTNLTDEQPVIYPSWVEANTAPSLYDVLGRRGSEAPGLGGLANPCPP